MKRICDKETVQLNLSLPKHDRDMLRKIAGKRMMDDPSKVESAASVGARIIIDFLNEHEQVEVRSPKENKIPNS